MLATREDQKSLSTGLKYLDHVSMFPLAIYQYLFHKLTIDMKVISKILQLRRDDLKHSTEMRASQRDFL